MKTLSAILILFLAGCGFTPEGDAARAFVAEKSAQAYDAGLDNALWFVCDRASIGSVRRRFGATTDKAAIYRGLCLKDAPGNVIAEPRSGATAP